MRRRVPRIAVPAGVLAAGAIACLGGACATTGRATPDLGEAPGEADGGVAVAAPGPINTALISDKSLCSPGGPRVDWSPVRRISRVEYNNMVRDLLGDTTQPANGVRRPRARWRRGQLRHEHVHERGLAHVQQYQQAAESLAQAAVATNRPEQRGPAVRTRRTTRARSSSSRRSRIAPSAASSTRRVLGPLRRLFDVKCGSTSPPASRP